MEHTSGVVTLNKEAVQSVLAAIARQILSDGLRPPAIVAVMKGGETPARILVNELASYSNAPILHSVRSSRSGLGRLKPLKVALARFLPENMLDRLRVIEHKIQTHLYSTRGQEVPSSVDRATLETFFLVAGIKSIEPTRPVLIVDDAVDTGATIKKMLAAAEQAGIPRAHVRVVAITVTTAAGQGLVDYVQYRGVLCRFPWSVDSS